LEQNKPMDAIEQLKLIKRNVVDFVGEDELLKKLRSGKKLKIKFGADPSAPDLHLGHLVVLKKLKTFQDLGHEVVFLIGDFTGMIGDPTGKSETRKPLTREIVERNAKTYRMQIFKVLDPNKTTIVYNSSWLSKMSLESVMNLLSQYTVARMLERADFKERFKANKEISIIEFLYPLLQGYDSVELRSDVEIGGHDQIFNLLVGRELQKSYGQDPQVVITLPLLEGTDGVQKMSKSFGNYIGFTESPKQIYGKTMSIPDELMIKYYRLLTDYDDKKVIEIEEGLKNGSLHPKRAKSDLAKYFVRILYSEQDADKAEKEFEAVFRDNQIPKDIPLFKLSRSDLSDGKISIAKLLSLTKLVDSTSEAKRMIRGAGVKIDGEKILDENALIDINTQKLISIGKRKFLKVICE